MSSGAGNGHAVQHLKEVKIQHLEQCIGGPLLGRKTAPFIESLLGPAKDFINSGTGIQFLIDLGRVSLIGQRQLVFQVDKSIVNRGGREHQDLCTNTRADHLIHQLQVTVLFGVFTGDLSAVAEVMAFINNYQIIVAPVQPIQFNSVGFPVLP